MSFFQNHANEIEKKENGRRAYYSFFDGYTEVLEEKRNGKQKIKRVYTDDYYKLNVSNQNWILLKIVCSLLIAASIFGFILIAGKSDPMNSCWFVVIAEALVIFFITRETIYVFHYIFAPRIMKVSKYNEVLRDLLLRIKISIGIHFLWIGTIVAYAITEDIFASMTLTVSVTIIGVIMACQFGILYLVKSKSYVRLKNSMKEMVQGYRIYT